ncbi:hypothetical protein RFI_09429 [Reticulomyxa filosa]|uniref:TATA element modulatory factor 1 TATA binding domain-containing protein n=1 Tax=Reticulomyxa filosa TaxID=46433 RepID=X6NP45_RETFI|nr:hypothetical protein RFI_09429 [Reticulomyxa filosa]|eukprot:ETO27703.1 hypothetical protein RFI_09429 [Reticulomyxa filosa]
MSFFNDWAKDFQGFVGEVSQRLQQTQPTSSTPSATTPKTATAVQKPASQSSLLDNIWTLGTENGNTASNNAEETLLTESEQQPQLQSQLQSQPQSQLQSQLQAQSQSQPQAQSQSQDTQEDKNGRYANALEKNEQTSPTPPLQQQHGDMLTRDQMMTQTTNGSQAKSEASEKDNEDKYQRLEQLYDALEVEHKQTKEQCDKLKILNNALKANAIQALSERNQCTDHLMNYECELENKKKEILELTQDKTSLTKQLDNFQTEIRELKQHIEDLSHKASKDKEYNNEEQPTTQIQTLIETEKQLKEKNRQLTEQCEMFEKQLCALQQSYNDLLQSAKLNKEEDATRQHIHTLEAENRTLVESLNQLKNEMDRAKQTQGQHYETIVRQKENDITRLESELEQSKQTITAQNKSIEDIKAQLDRCSADHSQLQQNYSSLQNQFLSYQEKMRTEIRALESASQNTQGDVQNELQNLLQKKAKEIEEVMKEGQEWANQCSELEKKVKRHKDTLSSKDMEIALLQTKVSAQEVSRNFHHILSPFCFFLCQNKNKHFNRITELLGNLTKQNEDSGSITEKNKLLQTLNTELKAQIAQSNQKLNELSEKIRALEIERDEYVQIIERKEAEISKYQMQIRDAKQSVMDYQNTQEKESVMLKEIQELRQEIIRLEHRARTKEERLIKERDEEKQMRQLAEQRNEELASEIPSATRPLLRQIESLRAAHSHKEDIWNDLEKSLRKRIRELENEVNDLLTNKTSYENECENLRSEQSKYAIQLNNLKAENKELKTKWDTLNDQMDNLNIKYDDLSMEYNMNLNKLKKIEADRKVLEENLQQSYGQFESNKNKWEETLSNERAKKNSLEKTINILQSKLHDYELLVAKNQKNNNENSLPLSSNDSENTKESTSPKDLLNSLFENQEETEDIEHLTERTGGSTNLSSKDQSEQSKKKVSGVNVWTISRITNELRQKDGELEALKQRLNYLQHSNDQLSDEIVKLKSDNESLLPF